jgi:hypothetical protein
MENSPDIACKANRLSAQVRADWLERLAFSAALLCLIHCLALPVALAVLPMLSKILALPETLHLWLLCLAVPASTLALVSGGVGRKKRVPLLLGGAGLALLAAGAILFGATAAETPATVAGSLALAAAHGLNWRLRHARHQHG